MAANISRNLIVGITVGVLACIISWLLLSHSSPLDPYGASDPWLTNLWAMLNFPVFLISLFLGLGNSPVMTAFVVFLQWFIIGFLVSAVINLFRGAVSAHNDQSRLE